MPRQGVLLLLLAGLLAGCSAPINLLSQRRAPAVYEPAREPMLIMVESYANPSVTRLDAEQLARRVHNELSRHRIGPLIDPAKLQRLRDQRPDEFRGMTTAAIGRAVGARQVLYIDLLESRLEQAVGSEMARGRMALLLRIIDVETGENRWPHAAEGYPLQLDTPAQRLTSGHDEIAIRQRMHELMSVRIGRLFSSYAQ